MRTLACRTAFGLTVLLTAIAGCSGKSSKLGGFAGTSLPAADGGLPLNVVLSGTPTPSGSPGTLELSQPGNPAFSRSGGVNADGSFNVGTGGTAGGFELVITNSTYTDPVTGAPVTVSGSAVYLAAASSISLGEHAHVALSPLSTIAWALSKGLRATTGLGPDATAPAANRGISLYFGANPGLVPGVAGREIWSVAGGRSAAPGLTDDLVVGLVTMGFAVRANAMGLNLVDYVTALAADAEDGVVDGVVLPPLVAGPASQSAFAGLAAYPTAPFGATLAADIASFLGSSLNLAGVTTATAQPLLTLLQSGNGRILPDAPLLTQVISPTTPGSRTVTLKGLDLDQTSTVLFGSAPGSALAPIDPSTVQADVPPGIASGTTLFVTVVNRAGFRHARLATITLP